MDGANGKPSERVRRLVLTYDAIEHTIHVAGQTANFDQALAILDLAKVAVKGMQLQKALTERAGVQIHDAIPGIKTH